MSNIDIKNIESGIEINLGKEKISMPDIYNKNSRDTVDS